MLLGERLRTPRLICVWSVHWTNGNSSAELLWTLYVFVLNCFSLVWLSVTPWTPLSIGFSSPMDSTPPGSSVHRILRSRILEWVAVPTSRVWRLSWVRWYMFSATSGPCLEWSRSLISGIIIIISNSYLAINMLSAWLLKLRLQVSFRFCKLDGSCHLLTFQGSSRRKKLC